MDVWPLVLKVYFKLPFLFDSLSGSQSFSSLPFFRAWFSSRLCFFTAFSKLLTPPGIDFSSLEVRYCYQTYWIMWEWRTGVQLNILPLSTGSPLLLLSTGPCNHDQIRKLWFLNPLSLRRFNQLKLMLAAMLAGCLATLHQLQPSWKSFLEKDRINKVSAIAGWHRHWLKQAGRALLLTPLCLWLLFQEWYVTQLESRGSQETKAFLRQCVL